MADLLTHAGLVAAESGMTSGPAESRASRACFSGSMERLAHAARRLRDDMPWIRHEEGLPDAAIAYVVLITRNIGRQRIHFEPAPLLFNERSKDEAVS